MLVELTKEEIEVVMAAAYVLKNSPLSEVTTSLLDKLYQTMESHQQIEIPGLSMMG